MTTESEKPVVTATPNPSNETHPIVKPTHRRKNLFRTLAVAFGIVLVAIGSFALGFSAGMNKARFSYRWGEQYEKNFVKRSDGGSEKKMLEKMDGRALRSGHGAAGEIIALTAETFALQGPDGQENTVSFSATTRIKKGGDKAAMSDLQVGDRVIVIGKPDDTGTIRADLIRVFDPDAEGLFDRLLR